MRFTFSIFLVTAMSALAAHRGIMPAGGAGRGASAGSRGAFMGRAGRAQAGHVAHMRQVQVSHPSPVVNQQHFVRDSHQVAFPRADSAGHAITRSAARVPPANHAGIVRNQAVVSDIRARAAIERAPGHYYWHAAGGVRYAHFYDRYRVHWYGFYAGPHFYWTRWWGSRWWWWDPLFVRWVYWYDGYWWWQGGDGLVYVYVNNNYYPYDEVVGGVTTVESRPRQPAAAPPSNPSAGKAYYSPDGARMIQVFGDRDDAFLYDVTGAQPKFLAYLAANVSSARFTGGASGKALTLLLDFKDGTFAVFDENGQSLTGTPEPAQPVKAAPAPAVPQPESSEAPPPAPQPGEIPGTPPAQTQ